MHYQKPSLKDSSLSVVSDRLRQQFAPIIRARMQPFTFGKGAERRTVLIEKRSAPGTIRPEALSDLEKQAADVDAQLAAIKGVEALMQSRRGVANAADAASDRLEARSKALAQITQEAAAFRDLAGATESYLTGIRFSPERLQAAAADDLGRLADVHEGIEAAEFFIRTHVIRHKTLAAHVKSAEAAKLAASAEFKLAADELKTLDARIAEIKAQAESETVAT